jgi:serine/threonine protein kinase
MVDITSAIAGADLSQTIDSGSTPLHNSEELIGANVSHYRIFHTLGRGSTGTVYAARDLRIDRPVALKCLSSRLARNPGAVVRFQREARITSALNSPHVCTIYDIDSHEGVPFIAMELLEGRTLQHLLKNGALQIAKAILIALQIAQALRVTHMRGVVHRDVKPGNLFVTQQGRIKLLDFGLATSAAMAPAYRNSIVGTAAYMSPEQAQGSDLDARTDLFSLGIVLYEMATGRAPFIGRNLLEVLDQVKNCSPALPSRINPDVPASLEKVIWKALQKDVRRRYQTASELLTDLIPLKCSFD